MSKGNYDSMKNDKKTKGAMDKPKKKKEFKSISDLRKHRESLMNKARGTGSY